MIISNNICTPHSAIPQNSLNLDASIKIILDYTVLFLLPMDNITIYDGWWYREFDLSIDSRYRQPIGGYELEIFAYQLMQGMLIKTDLGSEFLIEKTSDYVR